MNNILISILKKEFRHIVRDPQTLMIILVLPVIMLFLYGYAITLEMKEIEMVIVDHSKTPQSRQYTDLITSTNFFAVNAYDIPEKDFEKTLKERKARCILVIPKNFALSIQKNIYTNIQLLIDASDPNAANYIQKYLNQITQKFNFMQNRSITQSFVLEPRIFYNPDFKSYYFFVPGLIALIILLISALLTSIAIVREKESGTMEQILVSPVHPFQIILGKVIPYTILGFIDSVIILVIGHFMFSVPIRGSALLLAFSLLLYILTGLSFGLLISTVTKTQKVAMLATLLATILPTIMLSGFIFPVNSMPRIFQYVSLTIPATHFLVIIRGILLKGNSFATLIVQIAYLFFITVFLISVSIKKFNTTLE